MGVLVSILLILIPASSLAVTELASDCSSTAIMTALSAVISGGGGTVSVPACDYTDGCSNGSCWTDAQKVYANTAVRYSIVGQGSTVTRISYTTGAQPGGSYVSCANCYSSTMFNFLGGGFQVFRGMEISLNAAPTKGTMVYLRAQEDGTAAVFDDIVFNRMYSNGINICQNTNATQVVSRSTFSNKTNANAYGVRVQGTNDEGLYKYPAVTADFGTAHGATGLFVEGNTFDGTYHPTSAFTNAKTTFRYNNITSNTSAGVDVHGPAYDVGCGTANNSTTAKGSNSGGGQYEIYNNFIESGSTYNIYQRGGSGIITKNTHSFSAVNHAGVVLEIEEDSVILPDTNPRTSCTLAAGCPNVKTGFGNMVQGTTAGEHYYAIVSHTSTTDDKPTTGVNWATYWAETTGNTSSHSYSAAWVLGETYTAASPSCYHIPSGYFIWDNSYQGATSDYIISGQSIRIMDAQASGCIRQNTEYFVRAPQGGDVVESWSAYTCPHPAVGLSGTCDDTSTGTTAYNIAGGSPATTIKQTIVKLPPTFRQTKIGVGGKVKLQ